MKIDASLNALQTINKNMGEIPGRIMKTFHDPEAKEGLENVMTDMMKDQRAYSANVKAIRSMTTVEDILLNELRD